MKNIVDLFDKFSVPYDLNGKHSTTGWVQTHCPFCGSSSFHMGWNIEKPVVNCWKCGVHKNGDALASLAKIPLALAIKELRIVYRFTGLPSESHKDKAGGTEIKKLVLPDGVGELKQTHKDYLRRRGLNPKQMVKLWGIQGIGRSKDFGYGNSIFIPAFVDSKMVSYTTRTIKENTEWRYKAAPSSKELIPLKQLLLGSHYCRNACIVMEGFFDVATVGPGCVATCGTGYTKAQFFKITKFPTRYICFDNSVSAQARARKLLEELSMFDGKTENLLLDAKDANEATPREIKQLRKLLGN